MKCSYCHCETDCIHRDHVVPKYAGGGSEPGNIVIACIPCNVAKGVRSAEEFRRLLARRGLKWRDAEYRQRQAVYHHGDPRTPESLHAAPGCGSKPLIGWSHREHVLRRQARSRRPL